MRLKGLKGGRGGGKSHGVIEICLLDYIRNPNLNMVFIREVQKSIKDSVYQLIKDKIKALGLSRYFDIKTTEIRATKGSGRMVFVGMNDNTAVTIKSLEGMDRAVFEEAQTATQNSIEILLPTIRKAGAEVWFLWNPKNKTDPVDVLFAGLLPGEGILVTVNYTQNRHASATLIAEAERCKRIDPDRYRHVYMGGYEEYAEARIFKSLVVDEDFEFPKGMIRRFGADWGFGDPLVLLCGYAEIGPDGVDRHLYIRHEAHEAGVELSDTKAHFLQIPESMKWPITAGRERPERIRDLQKLGFKIKACVGGNYSEIEGVEYLQNFTIHIHRDCPKAKEEFENYKHPVDKLTGKILPTLPTTKNHTVEAARYMVEDMRIFERDANEPEPDPTPVPVKQKWGGKRG
jgi:phage terminase large subunit